MTKSRKKNKKDLISEIRKERNELIKFLLSDCELVKGSFMEVVVRCGRSNCHCMDKPIHPVTKISWYENRKLINKLVRIEDREWVKKSVNNYKGHKKAIAELEKLNEKEKQILKEVLNLKSKKYG